MLHIVDKTIGTIFIGAVGQYETGQPTDFRICIILLTAKASVRNTVLQASPLIGAVSNSTETDL